MSLSKREMIRQFGHELRLIDVTQKMRQRGWVVDSWLTADGASCVLTRDKERAIVCKGPLSWEVWSADNA